jgi:glycosyltransferase involved in cell wall biosynthesis
MPSKKRILLFSTLNPYPFWAGSETYWFEFLRDERTKLFDIHIVLADSPVTRAKAKELEPLGVRSSFYSHFNVDFLWRNLYKVRDRLGSRPHRTLPWYNAIEREKPDLVWFCVSTTNELLDLSYAVGKCTQQGTPYWIVIQHSYESIFFSSEASLSAAADVATGAKRMIFIADRNRKTLERAIGKKLENAFHSENTLPGQKINAAGVIAERNPVGSSDIARLFTLGRYSPKDKGQHLLVEALSQPQWRDREWQLSFVGVDDFGRSYLERLAKFFGVVDGKLNFVKFTQSVFEEIGKNDVLLMPSLAEGTPYAMIESMACGRPAMGTPVGGIPELITEGETGWLSRTVEAADVAEALEKMWTDRQRWMEMGRSARELIASDYVGEKSAEKLLNKLIEDTVSSGG